MKAWTLASAGGADGTVKIWQQDGGMVDTPLVLTPHQVPLTHKIRF
jgi:hypothetical protein